MDIGPASPQIVCRTFARGAGGDREGEPQHAGEHADRLSDMTRRQARRDQSRDPRLHLSVLDLDQ